MLTKTIQVPMEVELLERISRASGQAYKSRAAFIREACDRYLRLLETAEKERRYVEGYRRIPEDPIEGEVGLKLAASVLSDEDWK
ncbi:MAG: hypothetical protein HY814_07775 [Candidatus Riflebacteria bacterium]|nr:hypothetical protein [Candidatus Riflebacteria bacterium]